MGTASREFKVKYILELVCTPRKNTHAVLEPLLSALRNGVASPHCTTRHAHEARNGSCEHKADEPKCLITRTISPAYLTLSIFVVKCFSLFAKYN
jgi:hypothetical protein